jgi:LuxR family quorum-sensing system transcriptional regulator CciR
MEVIDHFISRAQSLKSSDELFTLMQDVTVEIGFQYFALINHVDFRQSLHGVIQIENYPAPWSKQFIAHGLYSKDPVLCASLVSNAGFPWVDVPKMITLTPTQEEILSNAAKNGLGDGYTVPANIPGEFYGSCSFAMRDGLKAPVKNYPLAHVIGAFAYQAARRLTRSGDMFDSQVPRLTTRQRDCLVWAIKGKTDWEISKILGVSQETVSRHLDMARERYGVTKRLPLAIHAIFDGQISFIEALF